MTVMQAGFTIAILAIIWSLYRVHRDPDVVFNLVDLLMENGRVSKVSCVLMGSFFVHSWIMIDLQAHAKMTEGYLTIYGATWVAPLLVKLFNPLPAGSTTVTTSADITTTTTKKGGKRDNT